MPIELIQTLVNAVLLLILAFVGGASGSDASRLSNAPSQSCELTSGQTSQSFEQK